MQVPNNLESKIHLLKKQVKQYEQSLQQDMNHFIEMADTSKLADRARETFTRLTKDKRTLFALLGVAVSLIIVRELLYANRPRRRTSVSNPNAVVSASRRKSSFLMEMVIMAMRTFALHYARKILIEYLERADRAAVKE